MDKLKTVFELEEGKYYKCNIKNCEYNNKGECYYCGDYWNLNDKDCIAFIDKED